MEHTTPKNAYHQPENNTRVAQPHTQPHTQPPRDIYLDYSATTKILPEALATYIALSGEAYGNPSSLHRKGQRANKIADEARQTLLQSLGGVGLGEIIFTASGTEANNIALFGRAYAKERFRKGMNIITTEGEHSSVSEPLHALEKEGFTLVKIPTPQGELDLTMLEKVANEKTILASFMMVNNETGAKYDLVSASRILRQKAPNAVLHVDATQGFLKVPFTLKSIGADMLTLSAHKVEGPKGIGALFVAKTLLDSKGVVPYLFGGGQEKGMRSGTLNIPAIGAFATAVDYKLSRRAEDIACMQDLRAMLIREISTNERFKELVLHLPVQSAPHILSIALPQIKSQTMLNYLDSFGISVSSGSACSSHTLHASSALRSFGMSEKEADCTIRVSLSPLTTPEDIALFLDALAEGIKKLVRIR